MSVIMRSGATGNGPTAPRGAFMRSGAIKQYKKAIKKNAQRKTEPKGLKGISPIVIAKLKKSGFESLSSLPNTKDELISIDGIGEKTAEKILELKSNIN